MLAHLPNYRMTKQHNQQFPAPIKRSRRWSLWIGVCLVLGAIAYQSQDYLQQNDQNGRAEHENNKSGKGRVAVVAKPAQREDVPIFLSGLGTVTGLRTVTVKSRVDGELIRVAFQEGQIVQAGQLLAEIDARAFEVQLKQTEGQLLRDEALLKNAHIDLERYRTLLNQDSISAQQTATQEALVKQYQGTVAIDRAQVDNAKLQLSYTKIIAPISGRVGLRLVDQGNMIKASDTNGLVVITQVQPISVLFTLPEDQIQQVMQAFHAGKKLIVEAYDRSGKVQLGQGSLVAVDNQIDLNTGTLKFKSQFDNRDAALFANQFVNVRMQVDKLKAVVTIPSAAIQHGSIGTYVYVVQNQEQVTVRPVQLGSVSGDRSIVTQGIQSGELVVVDGVDKLREGAAIKLIERNAEAIPKPVNRQTNQP